MEKIIIFFHIYYVDLLDEYLWYLNNIKTTKYSFDLYVSICDKCINDIIIDKLKNFNQNVKITICENRGADIGGFFTSLRNNIINFDLYVSVLYLHTKKSLSYGEEISYTWRGELLNDILINKDLIEFCIQKIKENNGIIGRSRCIFDINKSLTTYNTERLNYNLLCDLLNIKHQENSLFVAGTIFWSHPSIFKFIQNSNITKDNFKLTFDHSNLLEHSFERIFGNISYYLKLNILGINLDINNNIYHQSFLLYKLVSNINIYIFKINTILILPNQLLIQNLIKKKKLSINRIFNKKFNLSL
jgi:lipopolysaccharide biosynthesis protein